MNPGARLVGLERQAAKMNYFLGHAEDWHTNVPTYGAVRWQDVYAGTDVELGQDGGNLAVTMDPVDEADLSAVHLRIEGAVALRVDANGHLMADTSAGPVSLPVFRTKGGARLLPILAGETVTFDAHATLDSQTSQGDAVPADSLSDLRYSTYLGNSDPNTALGLAVDSSGNMYVTGQTRCTASFPVTAGAFQTTCNGSMDAFVAKLTPNGTGLGDLAYSTLLGGGPYVDNNVSYGGEEAGFAIAVDSSGNAYVTGGTDSPDFPTTPAVADTTCGSDGNCDYGSGNIYGDVFAAKLNDDGSDLVYSTFIGGSDNEGYFPAQNGNNNRDGSPLALRADGTVYITGATKSTDFPTTGGAYDTTYNGGDIYGDAFLLRLNTSGTSRLYSTFLGDTADDYGLAIALDPTNAIYVSGLTYSANFPTSNGAYQTTCGGCNSGKYDAFVTKFNSDGTGAFSTFLGGSQGDGEVGNSIAVAHDPDGTHYDAFVTGWTYSSDFPVYPDPGAYQTDFLGASDAFVTRFTHDGTGVVYSTLLGGNNFDDGNVIVVSSSGIASIAGWTWGYGATVTPFPWTTDTAFQSSFQGTCKEAAPGPHPVGGDGFIAQFNPEGTILLYSTYFGGSCDDSIYGLVIATVVGSNNVAYLAGRTESTDFPITPAATTTVYDRSFNGGTCGSAPYTFPCDDVFLSKLKLPLLPTFTPTPP